MEMAQTRETKGPEGFGGDWSEVKLEWLRGGVWGHKSSLSSRMELEPMTELEPGLNSSFGQ